MPELPDVERFKQYLDATALHRKVDDVEVRGGGIVEDVSAKKFRSRLKGRTLRSTHRHGKFLLVASEGPPTLALHFGMTGYLDYARKDREPPKHSRVLLHLGNGYRLAYVCQRKLGLMTLVNDEASFINDRDLGPDALDEQLTSERFCERLEGRRGMVKSMLMNQSIIAGLGNVYADEVLFQARVVPDRHVNDLGDKALRYLHRTMRRVLQTSIRHKAEIAQMPRTYLLRHRDTEERCPRCGHELKKARISGRGTYFCPHCQT